MPADPTLLAESVYAKCMQIYASLKQPLFLADDSSQAGYSPSPSPGPFKPINESAFKGSGECIPFTNAALQRAAWEGSAFVRRLVLVNLDGSAGLLSCCRRHSRVPSPEQCRG